MKKLDIHTLQVQIFSKQGLFEKRQQFYLTLFRWPKLSNYLYELHATVFNEVVYGRFTVTIFVTNMSKLNHWLGGIWYDMICILSDAETNIQSSQKSPIIYQLGPQKGKACLPIIISQEPLRWTSGGVSFVEIIDAVVGNIVQLFGHPATLPPRFFFTIFLFVSNMRTTYHGNRIDP